MKPERGSTDAVEMEEVEKDPKELLLELGMLVVEARTPDPSAKGRVEGPHCPLLNGGSTHECRTESAECRRALDLKQHMELLWRNGIPTCIDILLFPRCQHGEKKAAVLEGADIMSQEEYLLLERWNVLVFKKRHVDKLDKSVGPSMLLQAVRSYLHFSQLSSWLLSTGGILPVTVAYRLHAPGEGIGLEFSQVPDRHSFPQANMEHFGVKIDVEALPRQDQVVSLICLQDSCLGAMAIASKMTPPPTCSKTQCEINAKINTPSRGRALKRTRNHPNEISRKRENRKLSQACTNVCDSNKLSQKLIPKEPLKQSSIASKSDNKPHCLQYQEQSPSMQPRLSGLPKCVLEKHSPSRQMFKEKLLPLKPETLQPNSHLEVGNTKTTSRQLHSPKVLMTTNAKPDNVFTKKKFLDISDSSESDEWEARFLSTKIGELASPLSPEDIHAYLANLRTVSHSRSLKHEQSPPETEFSLTPKCKFFLGDELETSLDKGYQSGSKECRQNSLEADKYFPDISRTLFSKSVVDIDCNNSGPIGNKRSSLVENDLNGVAQKLGEISLLNRDESCNKSSATMHVPSADIGQTLHSYSKTENKQQTNSVCKDSSCQQKTLSCECGPQHDKNSTFDWEDSGHMQSDESLSNGNLSFSPLSGVCDASDVRLSPHTVRSVSMPECVSSLNDSKEIEPSLCSPVQKRASRLQSIPTTPTLEDVLSFRRHMTKSASMMFHHRTGLPTQSSPAPIKRKSMSRFDYDGSLISARAIKYALSCSKLALKTDDGEPEQQQDDTGRVLSTSAPASTNCLLGNFEESVLNGRIEPIGAVDGFTVEIGASGSFCPKHVILPVTAYFFKLSDDNAPSPYLGHINLEPLGKKGYHIPKKGTVQVTLFNPNKSVVKMFVVMYDMKDMPPNCQTFLRQRTLYMPFEPESPEPSYLRYLIHLRFTSSKSGKIHLHTDIRLIFARDKFELDTKVAQYELRSFTEGPKNPKFSPKR